MKDSKKFPKENYKLITEEGCGRGVDSTISDSFEHFLLSEPRGEKMDEILTQIYIKFQLIKDYLHANNRVSIFCIMNREFRHWVGLKNIF